MSRKPSHIPIFPDAYLRDNYRLSLEQHGLFFILMMEAWAQPDCMLPDNEAALAGIAQISLPKFRRIAPPVLAQWTRHNGRIFQKRLRKEWQYVQEKSAKRADAAKARWNANGMQMHSKCNADGMHLGGGGGVLAGIGPDLDGEVDARERNDPTHFDVIRGGRR